MKTIRLTALATLLLLPAAAHAHPGHSGHEIGGIGWGLAHPFTGLDHLLAMLAVGLWAAQLGGRARWVVPCSFVATMLGGAALGMAGFHLPLIESGILASVLVLGILIAAAARIPLAASAALAGVFALCHGYAHGMEMPENGNGLAFVAGLALSTALLHGIGILAGTLARRGQHAPWLRYAGAGIAAAAVAMMMGVL